MSMTNAAANNFAFFCQEKCIKELYMLCTCVVLFMYTYSIKNTYVQNTIKLTSNK